MWQINKAVTEHKKLVETSGRLQRMVPDKGAFVENLTMARQAAYEVQIVASRCRIALHSSIHFLLQQLGEPISDSFPYYIKVENLQFL